MPGLTSIIILTLNGLGYTRQCLASIRKFTPQPYELVLVDNGSTDGTPAFLLRVPGARVILNRYNRGFAGGCNQGLVTAGGDNLLLLNNDTVVTPNWLGNMLACLHSRPDIGLVGPYSNYAGSGNQLPVNYSNIGQMLAFARQFNRPDPARWREHSADWLSGFCLLTRREVVERVGLFDERFAFGGWEDVDYSRRVQAAGYKLYLAGDVFIHHYGHRSFVANDIPIGRVLAQNAALFAEKWGG
ncbi:glycosyltransferase family 2 protein [Desulfofundulus sp. TPOSR]|uniref:glycosyltransferase family 2 protein n=1 Tax=Desulfofundulus sp. TPOSR TaxID=2714340 RepID=UPI001408B636|nr:glycosyltransferase family 2 protein [Desulfofundulus sp. TPOSR]NHM26784.1 glycosyltransferase family 2 protein [Desulfofundulus sp. TPOSR]